MKFVYIANIRLPTEKAHGIQIMKMCEAFAREGVEVTLLVPRRFNHIRQDPFAYYGVDRNFVIVSIFSLDLVAFGRVGFLVQAFSFGIVAFLYLLFRKADILYARDEIPLLLLSFIKKHTVWEVHMPRNNIVSRTLARKAEKIVAISEGLKDFFTKKGVSAGKLLVAHDGVDLEDFGITVDTKQVRKELSVPVDARVVMYAGRLDRWKGVETLLKASEKLPNTQLVIIGEGDQLESFKKQYPKVLFTGYLPYRDLPRNQQAADVLVIPNSGKSKVSELYTSPLKVFAHMASGVPIVASALPSLKEVLHEKNAVLVEADNPEAFADGVAWVLEHKEEATKRAKRAVKDVAAYTWTNRASHILSFLKNASPHRHPNVHDL